MLLWTLVACAFATYTVWTEDMAYKVQPTTAVGAGTGISVHGAQGACENAQIIVTAQTSALSGVNMQASVLTGPGGATIPAASVTFFYQYMINFAGLVSPAFGGSKPAPQSSPTSDPYVPDPLIPFVDPYNGANVGAPFSVSANQNQPVWIDICIPKTATAGDYTGTITVTATSDVFVATVPVSLHVWNFALPDQTNVIAWFTFSVDQIRQYHANTWAGTPPNTYLKYDTYTKGIYKRYEELLHNHRVDVGQNNIPSLGSACTPPTQANWDAWAAAMQTYMDGTYFADGVPSSRIQIPSFQPGESYGYELCTTAQYTALAAFWATNLKAKGWFQKSFIYAYDEPPASAYPNIVARAQALIAADPGWKAQIFDTTYPQASSAATLNTALGTYVLCLYCYESWSQWNAPYGRTQWASMYSQGIKSWFYTANGDKAPYPAYATNTLLAMEPQMMMWGSWYEGGTGTLYWATNDYNTSYPWGKNIDWAKTGDGVLIYPGNHNGQNAPFGSPSNVAIDGPVGSIRLKMIRQGLQDWAMFLLAEQHALLNFTRNQVGRAYSQLGACVSTVGCAPINGQWYWQSNGTLLSDVRRQIAIAIEGNANVFVSPSPSPGSAPTAGTGATASAPSSSSSVDPLWNWLAPVIVVIALLLAAAIIFALCRARKRGGKKADPEKSLSGQSSGTSSASSTSDSSASSATTAATTAETNATNASSTAGASS